MPNTDGRKAKVHRGIGRIACETVLELYLGIKACRGIYDDILEFVFFPEEKLLTRI